MLSAIEKECERCTRPSTKDVLTGVDTILEIYQTHDCQINVLKSIDTHMIVVLATYNGDSRGPLLPGAKVRIMISARWRTKARLKNDPVLRHAHITQQMSSRTKHMTADGVSRIEPVRLFKHGATMGVVSSDHPLRNNSLVLGFTTTIMAHGAKSLSDSFKGSVRVGHDGVPALTDALRTRCRQAVFAIKILHGKGLFLGQMAFDSAELDDKDCISFPILSNSVLFPEGTDPHSRQAQTAVQALNRQNTSLSWDPQAAKEGRPSLTATFISDSTVDDVIRKAKNSGKGLGRLIPNEDLPPKSAVNKDAAF